MNKNVNGLLWVMFEVFWKNVNYYTPPPVTASSYLICSVQHIIMHGDECSAGHCESKKGLHVS